MIGWVGVIYLSVGVALSLMDAQGIKKSGHKSLRPWRDAIMRVFVCLILWPAVVACMIKGRT